MSQRRHVIPKASCKVVFHLPRLSAAMISPLSAAIWRSPVTRNSRPMITQVIQVGQRPLLVKKTKAEATRILSARGSSSLPSDVTRSIFRARYPSSQSEIVAMTKVIRATISAGVPPQLALTTKMAVKTMRAKVIEFGRFTRWRECDVAIARRQPFANLSGRFDKNVGPRLFIER